MIKQQQNYGPEPQLPAEAIALLGSIRTSEEQLLRVARAFGRNCIGIRFPTSISWMGIGINAADLPRIRHLFGELEQDGTAYVHGDVARIWVKVPGLSHVRFTCTVPLPAGDGLAQPTKQTSESYVIAHDFVSQLTAGPTAPPASRRGSLRALQATK